MASIRPLSSRQSVLFRADGSCQWKQGNTEVLVGVFGPMEAPKRVENNDKAYVDVKLNPPSGLPNPRITVMESYIKKTFEENILTTLHPRTQIKIVIQVLHEDGSVLASCMNGATMALLDAGIPLKLSLFSIDAILLNDEIVADPTEEQEKQSSCIFSFQTNPIGQIVSEWSRNTSSESFIPEDKFWEVRSIVKKASSKLHEFVRLTTNAKCLYECHGNAY
eukprot:TRINITY_DN1145_c0_g1_i1.p1 TRINITY_DN1145_c0_g1~~TRINITY_DN1145_c0_g1_i1.p1  ORF type:complete len:221 (-),score=20.90 TRINITY_DN1145_c0_g1_i1:109-771(-)